MIARGVLGRVALVTTVPLLTWLAYRAGGGADKPATPPPSCADRAPGKPEPCRPVRGEPTHGLAALPGSEGYQVVLRLVEAMKDARVDAPNFAVSRAQLAAHWRKMSVPWSGVTGDLGRLTTSIALRTSATETQWSMPRDKEKGGQWEPDARIWNMNEGSFDQREAIVAPAPATIAFRVTVPASAKLVFSPAILGTDAMAAPPPAPPPRAPGNPDPDKARTAKPPARVVARLPPASADAMTFTVTVVDAQGKVEDVYARTVQRAEARGWFEGSADLSAFAGQTVELRLRTAITGQASSVGLWGNPTILARSPTTVPYNVLWIVVDALRPDVLASFHDDAEDAARLAAHLPPLEAQLPKIPGLTPTLDDLAERSVRFTHAYSGGAWTRPGTLAMLAGARSSELGVDTTPWVLPEAQVRSFYGSSPPLLPLLLRKAGVETRAFVNNYFMVGYAAVGVDMGFERVDDHRYRTRDTLEITSHATEWLKEHKDERFFLFCNYNSPHEPWEPPDALQKRVPKPPLGPGDWISRMYLAEAAKDDEAIGVLLKALDQAGLRERTLVVVTADHGETLSSAHGGISALDHMAVRYHHAVSNYEETTRIPILLSLPGVLPAGREVKARVRSVDLAPTLLELLGLEPSPKMSGKSLMPLIRGEKEADERVVLSEGRGTRAILAGKWRYLVREGGAQTTTYGEKTVVVAEELFDLEDDPGERRSVAKERPEIVAEMRARLESAKRNIPVAGTQASVAVPTAAAVAHDTARVTLRLAGGGRARRVSGSLTLVDEKSRFASVDAIGGTRDGLRVEARKIDLAFTTLPDAIVGFDVRVDPPSAPIRWELFLDDAPWPTDLVFAGPFGFASPALRGGLTTDDARAAAYSPELPLIDPARDVGLFVTRERPGETTAPEREASSEGAEETQRLLREWGYAHASATPGAGPKKAPK